MQLLNYNWFTTTKNSLNFSGYVMKKKAVFIHRSILTALLFFLMAGSGSLAAAPHPVLSIIADQTPGLCANNGLNKLTEALKAKNISFEKVTALKDAKGKLIIVAGLSSGSGEA